MDRLHGCWSYLLSCISKSGQASRLKTLHRLNINHLKSVQCYTNMKQPGIEWNVCYKRAHKHQTIYASQFYSNHINKRARAFVMRDGVCWLDHHLGEFINSIGYLRKTSNHISSLPFPDMVFGQRRYQCNLNPLPFSLALLCGFTYVHHKNLQAEAKICSSLDFKRAKQGKKRNKKKD